MFVYQAGHSPLHRSDAVTKLVWLLAVTGTSVLLSQVWAAVALLVLVLLVGFVLGRLGPAALLRRLWPFFIIATWLFVFFSFGNEGGGRTLIDLGPLHVTSGSMQLGGALGLRILTLGAASTIFVLTTEPRRLVTDLIVRGRLPYRAGFGFYAALRFLPQLQSEARTIRHAHAIRAVATHGPLSKVTEIRRLTIPLLAGAIRRVHATAVAMDSRGFGAYKTRTALDVEPCHFASFALAGLQVALFVAAVVIAIAFGGVGVTAPVGG